MVNGIRHTSNFEAGILNFGSAGRSATAGVPEYIDAVMASFLHLPERDLPPLFYDLGGGALQNSKTIQSELSNGKIFTKHVII